MWLALFFVSLEWLLYAIIFSIASLSLRFSILQGYCSDACLDPDLV